MAEETWIVEQDRETDTVWMKSKTRPKEPVTCAVCYNDRVVPTGTREFRDLYPELADRSEGRVLICPNCTQKQGPKRFKDRSLYVDVEFDTPRTETLPGWKLMDTPKHVSRAWRAPTSSKVEIHRSVYVVTDLMINVYLPKND